MKPLTDSTVMDAMGHGDLCAWCVKYLAALGFFAWVNRTGAVRRYGQMVYYGKKGSPDVICCLPRGRMLWIEVKARKADRLNPDQEEFKKRVEKLGHFWLECRKPEDLQAYVEAMVM